MKITRIDIQGDAADRYATVTRRKGSDQIEVTILAPDLPNGRVHHVQADCTKDIWSMAECLQEQLDSHRGTFSDIYEYAGELKRFAD